MGNIKETQENYITDLEKTGFFNQILIFQLNV